MIKAHFGILGKELADVLAKNAEKKADIIECYKKVPKSVVISKLGERIVEKWQREWDQKQRDKSEKNSSRE